MMRGPRPKSATPKRLLRDLENHEAYMRDALRTQIGVDIRIRRGYAQKMVATLRRIAELRIARPEGEPQP